MPSISSASFHVYTKLIFALCSVILVSARPPDFWRQRLIWCRLKYISLCSSVSVILEPDTRSRREVFSQKDSGLEEGEGLTGLPKGEYLPVCVFWGKQHVTELVIVPFLFLSSVSCFIYKVI